MRYPLKLVVPMKPLERLSEQQLLDFAVAEFARATGFQLTFGGFEAQGTATITSVMGNNTPSICGLEVKEGRGLGGKAMLESRPRLTSDYERSTHITHDYDPQVLSEGIVSLLAVPVIVAGRTRAVLYGGTRSHGNLGAAFSKPVAEVAELFAREIRVRDEIARRESPHSAPRTIPAEALEELRESYAELRSIASGVTDTALRAKLAAVEQRLALLSGTVAAMPGSTVKLSPREMDVLSYAALGNTNAEIGRNLGLTESTVKSYLKVVTGKLDCSNRHAAVVTARRLGIIP